MESHETNELILPPYESLPTELDRIQKDNEVHPTWLAMIFIISMLVITIFGVVPVNRPLGLILGIIGLISICLVGPIWYLIAKQLVKKSRLRVKRVNGNSIITVAAVDLLGGRYAEKEFSFAEKNEVVSYVDQLQTAVDEQRSEYDNRPAWKR